MKNLTTAEIRTRMHELSAILEMGITEKWDEAYAEYEKLSAILDERYREENQEKFNAFYAEHIEGKEWEDIDPEIWGFYSDWHKDMYGFRPRHT